MQLNGEVQVINSVMRNTRYGQKPVYSMVVEGYEVDLGFGKPKYSEGQKVSIDVNMGKYGKYEIVSESNGTANNATTGLANAGALRPTAPPPKERGGFPIEKDNYQQAIIRQNALTNAVNLISNNQEYFAGQLESIDLPDLVLQIAYDFCDYSSGQREVKRAKQLLEANNNEAN